MRQLKCGGRRFQLQAVYLHMLVVYSKEFKPALLVGLFFDRGDPAPALSSETAEQLCEGRGARRVGGMSGTGVCVKTRGVRLKPTFAVFIGVLNVSYTSWCCR